MTADPAVADVMTTAALAAEMAAGIVVPDADPVTAAPDAPALAPAVPTPDPVTLAPYSPLPSILP